MNKIAMCLALASGLVLGSTQVHAAGNTEFGLDALNNATTGNDNSAFGENALYSNTTGFDNTASGYSSLYKNTTGFDNTASGYSSLYKNTAGSANTASGFQSLYSNTTGYYNTASGVNSLFSNTTGDANTASGYSSLYKNTTGSNNTASGVYALRENTEGADNATVGYNALYNNTTGSANAALGASALFKNTTGSTNTAVGPTALYENTTGGGNLAQGYMALYSNTTGNNNVGIGTAAGYGNSTGIGNVFLGNAAGGLEKGSNRLYIANNIKTPLLYGEFSATPADNKLGIGTKTVIAGRAINVWNGAHLTVGGVWTDASSRNLKDNIQTLSSEDANEALAALSPVRYVFKNSPDEEYVGFNAEDVPDLVANNDRKSLSPMDIVAVLTTVTKDQIAKKDAEIAELKERMLQMEMALAEVLRNQSSDMQVGLAN